MRDGNEIEKKALPPSLRPSARPFFPFPLPPRYSNGRLRRDGRLGFTNGALAWETPLPSTRGRPFSAMKEGIT